ncbi:putative leucine-rich repeat domain superfamily [Helianthus annuus]|nr:putative leucine-rich repeat domain superfamily [Helianthus annuus]KAJ0624950.1 putative leucine-rich repeat domain superfamily [Helianthus annuus]KAJ0628614.1 putative leucine-rich repeat domain superfamily [Helianthus annuus]KAJ0784943.1 putative leucine-rich repeat domain superfamily [Helianthus annuus]
MKFCDRCYMIDCDCEYNNNPVRSEWSWVSDDSDTNILEGLEPNPSLKKLSIYGYMGMSISPGWLVNLKNLLEITFFECNRCEHISALGRLPNLRVIKLSCMDSLKCFLDDDTNMLGDTTNMFLSVEELHIINCPSLVSLPSNLPKLKVLDIAGCDALVSLPDEIQSFKDLKELTITSCKQLRERYEKDTGVEWHKISNIPHVKIDESRFSNFLLSVRELLR